MKKIHLIYAACLLVGMGACAASVQKQVKDNFDVWKEYNTGAILFEDKAPGTLGSDIYHRIIPDAESYIKEQARTVLATLYNSPNHQLLNAVDFLKYSVSCFHPMDFMLSLCQCKLTNNLHEKTHKPFMLGGCCRIAECLRPGGERS